MGVVIPSELPLPEQICEIGRLMRQYGYVDSTNGNISARLDDERVLITPSGLPKAFMRPEHLIVIDMEGKRVGPIAEGTEHFKPSSETPMHVECYRKRADIGGVVHAHPPVSVALTMAGKQLQQDIVPEAVIFFGEIPTANYATPATTENRDAIEDLIIRHDTIMLAHHGSLTVAPTVWQAYLQLEALEQVALMTFYAQLLGGANRLLPEQLDKLAVLRRSLGYPVYNR
jgi:L-fuculose-phosphate aldolase